MTTTIKITPKQKPDGLTALEDMKVGDVFERFDGKFQYLGHRYTENGMHLFVPLTEKGYGRPNAYSVKCDLKFKVIPATLTIHE